jgi:hypothetical protein
MNVTAVVLSPDPVAMQVPEGVAVLNHCERFDSTAGIGAARRRALARVRTPWVFFLDSDDELPDDAGDVLAECVGAGAALVYTDELVLREGAPPQRRRSAPYCPALHAVSPLMVHHLAVMRTGAALAALEVVPAGELWLEHALFWQVARGGAAYVPRVGYHWRPGGGMHRARGIVAAQARALSWCVRQLPGGGRDVRTMIAAGGACRA